MNTSGQSKWIDSLERYVFCYYKHLLTEAEWHAWNYFIQTEKKEATEKSGLFDCSNERWQALEREIEQSYSENAEEAKRAACRDPVIKKLIEDYPNEFFVSVTYRILRDHPDEVMLNVCPKCLNLCGTPEAKLCLRCGHSWHSESVSKRE